MSERIPRAGDRLCDVPPGWVVRVPGDVVLVGPKVEYLPQTHVAPVRSGCHIMRNEDTVVRDVLGRFVDGEWQPYEPPRVLVQDLPLGTQVRFGGSLVWVVVTGEGGETTLARCLSAASSWGPNESVSEYRNDDTGWEWVDAPGKEVSDG